MADRIRYYWEKNGNAFWKPGRHVEKYGLPACCPLGLAGANAKAAALRWNEKLDEARKGIKREPAYKAGSLGHFYEAFKTKTAWKLMKPRTREDYVRCWPALNERFGKTAISQISADDSERLHAEVHPAHNEDSEFSWNEAHRTLKVWRALLNAMSEYGLIPKAPIGRVANPSPKGRDSVWLYDEVMQLAFTAALHGHAGMAAAIRLGYGAALQPVDAWTLERRGWRADPSGKHLSTQRTKTAKRVFHAVDEDTLAVVDAYLGTLPPLTPTAKIFRRYSSAPWLSKDTFGDDFRDVRALAFPGDTRRFSDLRRSALTEARLGGATKDDIGAAAANTIDKSDRLAETYLIAASENVLKARAVGRKKLAEKERKVVNFRNG